MNVKGYDDDELEPCINESIFWEVVFPENRWDIMMHYQAPENANWDKAYKLFCAEVKSIIKKASKEETKMRLYKDIERDIYLTEEELREQWDDKDAEERECYENSFEAWLNDCLSKNGSLEEIKYMNREHGYLLTGREAIDEFIDEYDGGDPTNCIRFFDCYERI